MKTLEKVIKNIFYRLTQRWLRYGKFSGSQVPNPKSRDSEFFPKKSRSPKPKFPEVFEKLGNVSEMGSQTFWRKFYGIKIPGIGIFRGMGFTTKKSALVILNNLFGRKIFTCPVKPISYEN